MNSAMTSYGLTGAATTPKHISSVPTKSGRVSKKASAMKVRERNVESVLAST